MNLILFLQGNVRWLGAGLTPTFFSSAGQTFFIALFAGEIRAGPALSHGDWGGVYMLATLGSAATLVWLGRIVDMYAMRPVAAAIVVALAVACVVMAAMVFASALGPAAQPVRAAQPNR